MTDDAMKEIQTKARASYTAYDRKRKKLFDAYYTAKTLETRIKRLADAIDHHANFMDGNLFMSGWVSQQVHTFADRVRDLADEL